jgi:hypothetical protein
LFIRPPPLCKQPTALIQCYHFTIEDKPFYSQPFERLHR